MRPELASRSRLASIAAQLLAAIGLIIVDVRIDGGVDVVPDVIGGVLVALAMLRLDGAISGAEGRTTLLVVLALLAVPITFAETVSPYPIGAPLAVLGLAPVVGSVLLGDLLARALVVAEPGLAARWRTTSRLVLWLGVVPLGGAMLVGYLGVSAEIQSPAALVVLAALLVPLLYLIGALWSTAHLTAASIRVDAAPSPEAPL